MQHDRITVSNCSSCKRAEAIPAVPGYLLGKLAVLRSRDHLARIRRESRMPVPYFS